MFSVALRKKFIAHRHIADMSDVEHPIRSHLYILEVMLEAEDLDSEGYVLDLDEVGSEVDDILALYRDKTLNNTEAFQNVTPTLEAFARVLGDALNEQLYAPQLTAISVRLWQDDSAWAMYDIEK